MTTPLEVPKVQLGVTKPNDRQSVTKLRHQHEIIDIVSYLVNGRLMTDCVPVVYEEMNSRKGKQDCCLWQH